MNNPQDKKQIIQLRLMQALQPSHLSIVDESHLHAGHPGAKSGGGHFAVTIVSEAFLGKTEIEKHRLVYKAVEDLIPNTIHALSIKTTLPGT